MTLAGAPWGGAPYGGAAYGGATIGGRVVSDSARATDSVTVVRTELAAVVSVVESAVSDLRALVATQDALTDAMRGLTRALQEHQRQNPRWWASPTFTAGMALLGVVIALLAFVGDRVDAAREDPARTEPPVTAPAVPGPSGPVDGPTTR